MVTLKYEKKPDFIEIGTNYFLINQNNKQHKMIYVENPILDEKPK